MKLNCGNNLIACLLLSAPILAQSGWELGKKYLNWQALVNPSGPRWTSNIDVLSFAHVPAWVKSSVASNSSIQINSPADSYLAFVWTYDNVGGGTPHQHALYVLEFTKPTDLGSVSASNPFRNQLVWTSNDATIPAGLRTSCSMMESSITIIDSNKAVWMVRFCDFYITALNVDTKQLVSISSTDAPTAAISMSRPVHAIGNFVPIFANIPEGSASLYIVDFGGISSGTAKWTKVNISPVRGPYIFSSRRIWAGLSRSLQLYVHQYEGCTNDFIKTSPCNSTFSVYRKEDWRLDLSGILSSSGVALTPIEWKPETFTGSSSASNAGWYSAGPILDGNGYIFHYNYVWIWDYKGKYHVRESSYDYTTMNVFFTYFNQLLTFRGASNSPKLVDLIGYIPPQVLGYSFDQIGFLNFFRTTPFTDPNAVYATPASPSPSSPQQLQQDPAKALYQDSSLMGLLGAGMFFGSLIVIGGILFFVVRRFT